MEEFLTTVRMLFDVIPEINVAIMFKECCDGVFLHKWEVNGNEAFGDFIKDYGDVLVEKIEDYGNLLWIEGKRKV